MNKKILNVIKKYKGKKGSAIPILQEVQEIEGYISKDSIRYISEHTDIPSAELYGIVTFYSMFRLKPQGRLAMFRVRIIWNRVCEQFCIFPRVKIQQMTVNLRFLK